MMGDSSQLRNGIRASKAEIPLIDSTKQEDVMRAGRNPGDVAFVLAPMVLAIGQPSFPKLLLDTVRDVANVGHCMVFAFEDQAARCTLDIGNIGIGADLGAAYSGHFYVADPNHETLLLGRSLRRPILLPSFSPRMYSNAYRKMFFEDGEIVDKSATAIWVDDTCFYVNFYRTTDQGRFTRSEAIRLSELAPALAAIVARHCQEQEGPDGRKQLERLFETRECFLMLTPREKEVCRRILSGYGTEAIASDLGISLHSAFTYRKRAYEKLGISSQNELFAIALRLMARPRAAH
jgi:DNA-binding CsgD family transcriptional regulator